MIPKTLKQQSPVKTEISEIFSSLQGEGIYLGVKQIFVRFGRCNLTCSYCDESSKTRQNRFKIFSSEEMGTGIGYLEKIKGPHHSVSLTGGEPLLSCDTLTDFLPLIKRLSLKTYLETNGTLPDSLKKVIDECDIIAMDMKLPSAVNEDLFDKHEAFLKIAAKKEVFVKVVVTTETTQEEIVRCAHIVETVDPKIAFVLQPVSGLVGIETEALRLIEQYFFKAAREHLSDVRVIPQMHKIWGIR